MKKVAAIERLNTELQKLGDRDFPTSGSPRFNDFYTRLRDLVIENFGYHGRDSFHYDKSARLFMWEEEEVVGWLSREDTNHANQRPIPVFIKATYTISPDNSTLEDFYLIVAERDETKRRRNQLAKAILMLGGKL